MATVSTNNTPAIEVEHLSKQFGDFLAVDDLSFTVPRVSMFDSPSPLPQRSGGVWAGGEGNRPQTSTLGCTKGP